MSSTHAEEGHGWLRLDEAAQRLGITPQVLWSRLAAQGREVRRGVVGGRAVSLVRAGDVGIEPGQAEIPLVAPVEEEDDDDGGVGTSIWTQLHELRAERDVLEETLERVLAERRERAELEREQWAVLALEMDDLRGRRAAAESAADESRRRCAELEARLERAERELRADLDEAGRVAEAALERERAQSSAAEFERARRVRLERELATLQVVERSNQRYLDRLEEQLRAARVSKRVG